MLRVISVSWKCTRIANLHLQGLLPPLGKAAALARNLG